MQNNINSIEISQKEYIAQALSGVHLRIKELLDKLNSLQFLVLEYNKSDFSLQLISTRKYTDRTIDKNIKKIDPSVVVDKKLHYVLYKLSDSSSVKVHYVTPNQFHSYSRSYTEEMSEKGQYKIEEYSKVKFMVDKFDSVSWWKKPYIAIWIVRFLARKRVYFTWD